MRYELQSIGVWSAIKVSFFFNLVAGFLAGLVSVPFIGVIATLAMAGPIMSGADFDPGEFSAGSLFIVVPLICAVLSAVFGTLMVAILTVVYNLVATMLGGLEFDYRDVESMIDQPEAETGTDAGNESVPMAVDAARRPETPPPPPVPANESPRRELPPVPPAVPEATVEHAPDNH